MLRAGMVLNDQKDSQSVTNRKILLVANTGWYLYNFRLSLIKRLTREGFEVVLACPQDEFAQELQAIGFHTIFWDLERQAAPPWEEWDSIRKLTLVYRHEKPSLVHHFTIKPVTYGSLSARLAGVPAIINSITGRGYVFLGTGRKAVFLQAVVKFLFHLAYYKLNVATTFENESDLSFFVHRGIVSDKNLWLINGVGVDTELFDYKPESKEEIPIVVFPGRLLWAKGVGTLVEAARILKTRLPLRIVLVGKPDPGNPETISERIIRAWVDEGIVEWWGWQADMRLVYQKCHIVVLPSMGEGISKALLEAAACGRPIVATDVPGCREVVIPGVTGYLIPFNDPNALAEKLEKLATHPKLRTQMGQAGRRLIEEKFSDELVNEEILSIYRTVLRL